MKFSRAGLELDFNRTTFGVERAYLVGDPTRFCFVRGKNFALPSGNNFLVKSNFSEDAFSAEFQYFSDLTARLTVQESEFGVSFRYVFTNEGKKPIALEEGDIGFYAGLNDSFASPEIALKRRLRAHVRLGVPFSYIYPVRASGSGPVLSLVVTKGEIASYSLEREFREEDSGEIVLNFPAMELSPNDRFECEFVLFPSDGRWDFEEKAAKLGAEEIKAYDLVGFEGDFASIRAPQALYLESEGEKISFKDGECAYLLRGEGEKQISVVFENRTYPVTTFTVSRNICKKRAEFLIENQRISEGPLRGAFCAYDRVERKQIVNKKKKSEFSLCGAAAAPLLFLLSSLNEGEIFVDSVTTALNDSLDFYDREIFSDAFVSSEKKKRVRLFERKKNADRPFAAAIKFEEYLYKKDLSYLIESATILTSYLESGEIGSPIIASEVFFALKREEKEAIASSLKEAIVKAADAIACGGNGYSCSSKAPFTPEKIAGVLSLLSDAYLLTKNSYYLILAEDHLARLNAFFAPSLSYAEDSIPFSVARDYASGSVGRYSPSVEAAAVAYAFDRFARASSDPSYKLRAEHILKGCLTLFDKNGEAARGRLSPKKVNDKDLSLYPQISFGEDVILYYFNLLFKRRSSIIK